MTAGTLWAFLPEGFQVYFTDPEQYCGDPYALDSRFMDFINDDPSYSCEVFTESFPRE